MSLDPVSSEVSPHGDAGTWGPPARRNRFTYFYSRLPSAPLFTL